MLARQAGRDQAPALATVDKYGSEAYIAHIFRGSSKQFADFLQDIHITPSPPARETSRRDSEEVLRMLSNVRPRHPHDALETRLKSWQPPRRFVRRIFRKHPLRPRRRHHGKRGKQEPVERL